MYKEAIKKLFDPGFLFLTLEPTLGSSGNLRLLEIKITLNSDYRLCKGK
jgi:hypothetical protein